MLHLLASNLTDDTINMNSITARKNTKNALSRVCSLKILGLTNPIIKQIKNTTLKTENNPLRNDIKNPIIMRSDHLIITIKLN